jgi:phage I-like protein
MTIETSFLRLDAAGPEPPTEFRIFAAGTIRFRDRPSVLFDAAAAESVMQRAADFGAEYPLDYGHAHFVASSGDPAEHHKAAGWFKPEVRNGELWATGVTWTPAAREKLRNREYRYISPAYKIDTVKLDSSGASVRRVTELVNVALTNVPATSGLKPLVASTNDSGTSPGEERHNMGIESMVLAATIGAPASASEADLLARAGMHKDVATEVLKLAAVDNAKEALGVVAAWKAKAAEADALRVQLAAVETEKRKAEIDAKVQAKVEAKLITPAQGDWARAHFATNVEGLDAFLATFTAPVPGTQGVPRAAPVQRDSKIVVPPPEELKFFNISEEDFIKTQKLMIERGDL